MIGFSIMMWFISFVLCVTSISLLKGNTASMHGKVYEETYDKIGYGHELGKITLFMGIGMVISGFAALIGSFDTGIGCATVVILVIIVASTYMFYKTQKRFGMKGIYENSQFPGFKSSAKSKYGDEKGKKIYNDAVTKLKNYLVEADYRNDKAVKKHMFTNIFPLIAIYQSCMENGLSKEEAYDYSLELAQIGATNKQIHNSKIGKLPFGYGLFKMFCKTVMNKSYPSAGWDTDWKKYDKEEIHFDMKSCVYAETTKACGCPELCTVFCANDDTVFKGYEPSIVFERSGTIARGQDVCDFHYKKGKMV